MATAQSYALLGSRVILAARSFDKLNAIKASLLKKLPSAQIHAVKMDVTDRHGVFAATDLFGARFCNSCSVRILSSIEEALVSKERQIDKISFPRAASSISRKAGKSRQ